MLKTCQFITISCSLTLYLSVILQRMASTSYLIDHVRDKLFGSSDDDDDDDLSDLSSGFESEETQTHDDDQGPTTNDNILSSEDSDSEIEIRNNAEIEDDHVAPPLSKRRRFSPREKLICNLEAALDENNYELMNVMLIR